MEVHSIVKALKGIERQKIKIVFCTLNSKLLSFLLSLEDPARTCCVLLLEQSLRKQIPCWYQVISKALAYVHFQYIKWAGQDGQQVTGCLKCLLKEVRRQCEFLAAFKQRENGRKRKKCSHRRKNRRKIMLKQGNRWRNNEVEALRSLETTGIRRRSSFLRKSSRSFNMSIARCEY